MCSSLLIVPALALVPLASAQAPAFVPLGHPNGLSSPAWVAADGTVAVGLSQVNRGRFGIPGDLARRWRAGAGFFVGLAPAAPPPIGAGCAVQFDPGVSAGPATRSVDGAGAAAFGMTSPSAIELTGPELLAQAVVLPTVGPLGFDPTNGLRLTLGR